MKNLKVLLNQYLGLFVSASAYQSLVQAGWKKVLGFFLLSHLVAGGLLAGYIITYLWPQTEQELIATVENIREAAPQDLIIDWNAESIKVSFLTRQPADDSTTVNETAIEKIDDNQNQKESIQEPKELSQPVIIPHQVVEDSKILSSLFPGNSQSSFLELRTTNSADQSMTASNITVFSDAVSLRVGTTQEQISFTFAEVATDLPSFRLTKDEFLQASKNQVEAISQNIQSIWVLIFIFAIPITLFFSASNLLIDGFLVYLLIRLNQFKLSIGASIQLSLLAGGVAAITNQLAVLIYPTLTLPIYSLTFWLVMAYVLLLNKRLW